MMETSNDRTECAACRHEIDAAAKICPFCGADPRTGQKVVDAQAMLEEVFHPRRVSASESVLEYARHRQGLVIAAGLAALFLILLAVHSFISGRNQTDVTSAAAVPLSELTDLSTPPEEGRAQAMPDMQFQFDGDPRVMRTFIIEPGAVPPPEVVAAQQQQQQQARQQQAAQAAQHPKAFAGATAH